MAVFLPLVDHPEQCLLALPTSDTQGIALQKIAPGASVSSSPDIGRSSIELRMKAPPIQQQRHYANDDASQTNDIGSQVECGYTVSRDIK